MLARGVHDECVGGAWKVHGVCVGSAGFESGAVGGSGEGGELGAK